MKEKTNYYSERIANSAWQIENSIGKIFNAGNDISNLWQNMSRIKDEIILLKRTARDIRKELMDEEN